MTLIRAEWDHPLISLSNRKYGGAFNLYFKRGGNHYKVHVRQLEGEESTVYYQERNGEDMWNEPLPDTILTATKDWLENNFDETLELHANKAQEALDNHVRIGIDRMNEKISEYYEKITLLDTEMTKARKGEGFDPYVDRDE